MSKTRNVDASLNVIFQHYNENMVDVTNKPSNLQLIDLLDSDPYIVFDISTVPIQYEAEIFGLRDKIQNHVPNRTIHRDLRPAFRDAVLELNAAYQEDLGKLEELYLYRTLALNNLND